jgi:hypothetical protein
MGVKLSSDINGKTQTKLICEKGHREIFGAKRYEVTGGWRKLLEAS